MVASAATARWFALTNTWGRSYLGGMTVDQATRVVQMAYPQVYLACHTRHHRKRSTEHRLSARDAAILAHLDGRVGIVPVRLARHLGVARSTLSEALKRLIALGYARRAAGRRASKPVRILLTVRGADAIRDTSVLETRRLHAALSGLTEHDRAVIAKGMTRLAAACRAYVGERAEAGEGREGREAREGVETIAYRSGPGAT